MNNDLKERLVKSRVKLLKNSPFFGTLLLHAGVKESTSIPTACTDGRGLIFNPDFASELNENQFTGVLLHEILHCALQHVDRMKDIFKVDPFTANIACDIVVNGIIDDNNLTLPDCAVRDNDLKHLSVREIYSILKQKQAKDKNHLEKKYGIKTVNVCLVEPSGDSQQGNGQQDGDSQEGQEGQGSFPADSEETDWKDVMNKAATIARMKKAGPTGAAMERIFKELLEPTIDWRTILYKYITECRNDFDGYDRRFAHQNLYLDDFSGTQVHVLTYIDVSGSIDEQLLTEFISEINGAINAVTNINGEVHCFDTRLHYVCELENIHTDFKLIGGGGTCFKCIFNHIAKYKEEHITSASTILPIILTDGYADVSDLNFPDRSAPLLWVVCPGGVDSDDYFPFGDVTRIVR